MVLGTAAGEYCKKLKPLLSGDCNMFLSPSLDRLWVFLAGGTGVSRVLVQMLGLWFWDGCGGILQKTETLAVWGLQYLFATKVGCHRSLLTAKKPQIGLRF